MWVITSFALIGGVFVLLGAVILGASNAVVEVSQQYGGPGNPNPSCAPSGNMNVQTACTVSLTVPEDMEPPVYVYYELENFYQNHRRYVKSRDDVQLREGKLLTASDLSDCEPLIQSQNGTKSPIRHPCGLIAGSFFNDSFSVSSPSGITIDEKDIAWKTDRDDKFKAVPLSEKNAAETAGTYMFLNDMYPGVIAANEGVENEHFIVWMRVAALPNFRKLWGKIDTRLAKDTQVTINVQSNFVVDSFEGKKSVVLSTTSWIGGKNPFLGIAYLVVGCICLLMAGAFAVKQFVSPRRPGDVSGTQWSPE